MCIQIFQIYFGESNKDSAQIASGDLLALASPLFLCFLSPPSTNSSSLSDLGFAIEDGFQFVLSFFISSFLLRSLLPALYAAV